MPNVYELIRDHVSMSISCLDRLYINGYLPSLQTSGQVRWFLEEHLRRPMPSPALFRPIHDRFVQGVKDYASRRGIPLIRFEKGQRKDDIVAKHRARYSRGAGVVVIGAAQERAWSFKGTKRTRPGGSQTFDFSRQSVWVNHYYFYIQDLDWGPSFLKIGSYAP
jgi:hypothetical protein